MTVRGDGSGSLEVNCTFPDRTTAALDGMLKLRREMLRVSDGPGETELPAIRLIRLLTGADAGKIEEMLRPYEEDGIIAEEVFVESERGERTLKIKLLFKDLEKAAGTDLFREYGFSISKNGGGDYVFFRKAAVRAGEGREDPAGKHGAGEAAPLLRGFEARIKVNAPGKILRTNAHRDIGRTAVWNYEFDKDSSAFRKLQTTPLKIIFSGEGLDLPEIAAGK
ncbi:MAG: hypothetical protein R6V03_07955 [Kiritimatiellia bacterium]